MVLSIVIPLLGIGGGIGCVAYKLLRPRFPVEVSCWFCGGSTTVPYGNRNCWDCPKCDQYNGFDKDGGYNKPIPAQHNSDLNHPISSQTGCHLSSPTVLCDRCNRNQLLKVKQLASFIPFNEANYDAEVDAFKDHLERVYKLCLYCEATAQEELQHQDDLLKIRLSQSELEKLQSTYQTTFPESNLQCGVNSPYLAMSYWLFHCASLLCALALCTTTLHPLAQQSELLNFYLKFAMPMIEGLEMFATLVVFLGLFLNIFSKLVLGKSRIYLIDGASCFLWLALLFSHLVQPTASNHKGMSLLLHAVLPVANVLLVCLCAFRERRPRNTPTVSVRRLSLDSDRLEESSSHDVGAFLPDGSTPKPSNDSPHRMSPRYSGASPGQMKRTAEFISGSPAGWCYEKPWDTIRANQQFGQSSSRPPSVLSEPVLRERTSSSHVAPRAQQAELNSSFTSAWSEPVFGQSRGSRVQYRSSRQSEFLQHNRAPSSVWSEPAYNQGETTLSTSHLNEDLDNEFDSISLGPLSTTLKRTTSGMFSTMPSWNGQRSWSTACIPQSLHQRRPLISPAKLSVLNFRSSTPTGMADSSYSSKPEVSTSCLQQRNLFSDRASMASDQFSVYREPSGDGSRKRSSQDSRSISGQLHKDENFNISPSSQSSRASFCPVDSTTNKAGQPMHSGEQWWRSGWTVGAVLTLSVFTNIFIIVTSVLKS